MHIHETDLLETEGRDIRAPELDLMDTGELLHWINREDHTVPEAVKRAIPAITEAVHVIAGVLERGGRLFYVGAGTSGRLGVLDAYECPPTFGTPPELVQAVVAGGADALQADETAEDCMDSGAADLAALNLCGADAVVGLAASGRTPYVLGALKYAGSLGAAAIAISCVRNPAIGVHALVSIEVPVGPEVLTGSTRLKAGTAQKLVLNMISTAVMIRLGKVYGNLMVDLQPTNGKLRRRAARMTALAAGTDETEAAGALALCGYNVKSAILMLKRGLSAEAAAASLARAGGNLRRALEMEQATGPIPEGGA